MTKSHVFSLTGVSLLWALGATACIALGALEEPATPSGAITAIPIEPTEASSSTAAPTAAVEREPAADAALPAATNTAAVAGTAAGTAIAAGTEPASVPVSGAIVLQIDPTESQARFVLDEVLRGSPNTVVGVTNQVAGEVAMDFDDPASARVGVIRINARTLVTDDDRRNRAMQNRILFTNQHEFITFTPTEISGLPEAIRFGEPSTLQITGDLTITDVTNQVTFDVRVTPVSETHLVGSAATTILRADYGLQIPSLPFIADVDTQVLLEIEFVARAPGTT